MSSEKTTFDRQDIELFFKELAKEYRKLGGKKLPAEIVLIGGASVLINYGFRHMTTDIDALISAASMMKDAINNVTEKYGLPRGWLNENFKRTKSYTPKIVEHSKHYKTFYGVIEVRTVADEYLIAMKLMSGRQYKNDLSDILGILASDEKKDKKITLASIKRAAEELYGEWSKIPKRSRVFIESAVSNGNYEQELKIIAQEEKENRKVLIEFEEENREDLRSANINDIISELRRKK